MSEKSEKLNIFIKLDHTMLKSDNLHRFIIPDHAMLMSEKRGSSFYAKVGKFPNLYQS